MQTQIAGDKLRNIETYTRVRLILVDFLRGYPVWRYWGIFEYFFGNEMGKKIIGELKEDGFLKVWQEQEGQKRLFYSLTAKGAEFASSLKTHFGIVRLTKILGILAGMTIVIGLAQYILSYAQFPLF